MPKPVSDESVKALCKVLSAEDEKEVFDLCELTLFNILKDRQLARITKNLETLNARI